MRDREKVLRFFAIAHRRQHYVRSPFREFLNEEMASNQHALASEITLFDKEFRQSLEWTQRVFSGMEFRSFRMGSDRDPNGYWDNRRTDLLYETEMVGFHRFREHLDAIWQGLPESGATDDYLRWACVAS
jgi:hypothetical protein